MQNNLVGMFDSGLGGLSVWRELASRCPNVSSLFVADQRYCPYGKLSDQQVLDRSMAVCEWLVSKGATQIIIACNTATSIAVDILRQRFSIPVIGIEPAVKPAAEHSASGKIAILATEATLRTARYRSLTDRYGKEVDVYPVNPPGWVEAVEDNNILPDEARERVRDVISPLLANGVDQIALGCTHYPFLMTYIQEEVAPNITIIDPAPAVIKHASALMLSDGPCEPSHQFFTTGNGETMKASLTRLLGIDVGVAEIAV